jgi:hypothetical protein
MNNGLSAVKLLNFFKEFRSSCLKTRHSHERLIDLIKEVACCETDDEVLLVYSMILNQVRLAFNYLEKNTKNDEVDLREVRSYMEGAINDSRSQLFITLREKNMDPSKYPIYLQESYFKLYRSFANGLSIDNEDIDQESLNEIIEEVVVLIKKLEDLDINFGDKSYLQNLLKRIIIALKNYNKFTLSDELYSDSLAFHHKVVFNEELKKYLDFVKKTKDIVIKICNKIKPDIVNLELSLCPPNFKAQINYNNKASN